MTQESLEEFARRRLGTTLNDKWELDALLGVGGTASVYSASHRNGKRVAIKVLHPELSAHTHFRERFLREAYVGNHIEHPGAVTVYDDDVTEDGCAFLVMDLLEGENLEARRDRKGGVLDPLEVLSLTDDVLDTLQASHNKGVIHRDIKPENLFLTHENTVRLLDFGIARINVPENPGQTLAGVSMGTPAFMPPEQASAHWDKVDAQSDLWALGASMFTLLTGRYVHQGGTVNESLVLAVTKPAPKIENIDPSLPRAVVEIVNKALERDKSNRYKSAAEMQFDVRLAYRELQDAPEGERYSVGDGRLAIHSAPPGPVFYRETTSEPGSITAEPLTSDASVFASRKFDNKRLALFGGAATVLVILVFWLVAGGKEESEATAASVPHASEAAPEAQGTGSWNEIRDDMKKQQELNREHALEQAVPVEDAAAPEHDAEEEQATVAKRPNRTVRRPLVRAPVRAPKPEPSAEPTQDEFDPFAKRH